MFEEPEEDEHAARRRARQDPTTRAYETMESFKLHALMAAVYEGPRKFSAEVRAGLEAEAARELRLSIGRLEKGRLPPGHVVVKPELSADAARVLAMSQELELTLGDYHLHRRPGEVVMVRWLEGEGMAKFYERLQAHLDAALDGHIEDERQANAWKDADGTEAYLAALSAVKVPMTDWLGRKASREGLFLLSTHTADEMNIAFLCDHLMGVDPADVVGPNSAPPTDHEPTEAELAWYFKLFALRGTTPGPAPTPDPVERMCLFTYLQKADDDF